MDHELFPGCRIPWAKASHPQAPRRTSRRTRSTLRSPLAKVRSAPLLRQTMAQGGAQAGHQLVGAERLGGHSRRRRRRGLRPLAASSPRLDSTTIGTGESSRMRPISAWPSMSGRPRSSKTRSGRWWRIAANALRAGRRLERCDGRARPASRAAAGGSAARPSTIRMVAASPVIGAFLSGKRIAHDEFRSTTTRSAVIWPVYAPAIVPPSASTKPLAMGKPPGRSRRAGDPRASAR